MVDEKDIDSLFSFKKLVEHFGVSKILHVDDEPQNLRVLVDILKEEKYIQFGGPEW